MMVPARRGTRMLLVHTNTSHLRGRQKMWWPINTTDTSARYANTSFMLTHADFRCVVNHGRITAYFTITVTKTKVARIKA